MHLVVVKRGEQALYTRLTAQRWTGGVRVLWDRRGGERRMTDRPAHVDRRRRDRRRPPPDTWEAMGFLMVHQLDAPP